jgi:hypothetical protein
MFDWLPVICVSILETISFYCLLFQDILRIELNYHSGKASQATQQHAPLDKLTGRL